MTHRHPAPEPHAIRRAASAPVAVVAEIERDLDAPTIGCGDTIARIRAERGRPALRDRVPGCPTCDAADPMTPAHDAAPRCESGRRNHCTCTTCY